MKKIIKIILLIAFLLLLYFIFSKLQKKIYFYDLPNGNRFTLSCELGPENIKYYENDDYSYYTELHVRECDDHQVVYSYILTKDKRDNLLELHKNEDEKIQHEHKKIKMSFKEVEKNPITTVGPFPCDVKGLRSTCGYQEAVTDGQKKYLIFTSSFDLYGTSVGFAFFGEGGFSEEKFDFHIKNNFN